MSAMVIVCKRCGRRFPQGTSWCECGAFLEFEGEQVASDPAAGSDGIGAGAGSGPDQRPVSDPRSGPVSAPRSGPVSDPGPAPRSDPAVRAASDPFTGRVADPVPGPESGARVPGAATPSPSRSRPRPGGNDPARTVDAVHPDEIDERRDAPTLAPALEFRPGDVRCRSCQAPNPPDRRFCRRCGEPMAAPADGAAAAGAAGTTRRSWWRRLVARARREADREMGQPGRAAMQIRRGLDWRARLFRTGLVGALGIVLLSWLGPWRTPVTRQLRKLSGGPRYALVVPSASSVVRGAVPGRGAELALDDGITTSWAGQWTDPGPGLDLTSALFASATCDGENPAGPAFEVTFADPVDIDRIRLLPGRYAKDPVRTTEPPPRVLQVLVEPKDGTPVCSVIEMEDKGERQARPLKGRDVVRIRVTVVGVFPRAGGQPVTGITDVRFDRTR